MKTILFATALALTLHATGCKNFSYTAGSKVDGAPADNTFSAESNPSRFRKKWNDAMTFFEKEGQHKVLITRNKKFVRFHQFINVKSNKQLVIFLGFSESSQKYAEFIYDFYRKGYSVHILTNRGQGESDRIGEDPTIVDVESFEHYYADASNFVEIHVLPYRKPGSKVFLFAHSTGALIAAHVIAVHPEYFNKAVLSSPLFDMKTSPVPKFFAPITVSKEIPLNRDVFNNMFPNKSSAETLFSENNATQSILRWSAYHTYLMKHPELYTRGPSIRWLREAIYETSPERIELLAKACTIPVLVEQATADTIVELPGQNAYVDKAKTAKIIRMEGSQHEIYREIDVHRDKLLKATFEFFEGTH